MNSFEGGTVDSPYVGLRMTVYVLLVVLLTACGSKSNWCDLLLKHAESQPGFVKDLENWSDEVFSKIESVDGKLDLETVENLFSREDGVGVRVRSGDIWESDIRGNPIIPKALKALKLPYSKNLDWTASLVSSFSRDAESGKLIPDKKLVEGVYFSDGKYIGYVVLKPASEKNRLRVYDMISVSNRTSVTCKDRGGR